MTAAVLLLNVAPEAHVLAAERAFEARRVLTLAGRDDPSEAWPGGPPWVESVRLAAAARLAEAATIITPEIGGYVLARGTSAFIRAAPNSLPWHYDEEDCGKLVVLWYAGDFEGGGLDVASSPGSECPPSGFVALPVVRNSMAVFRGDSVHNIRTVRRGTRYALRWTAEVRNGAGSCELAETV